MKEGVSPEDSSSEEGVSSEEWSEELDTESDDDVLNDSTLISAAVRERDGRWRKWRRMRSRELQPVHGMRKRDSSSTSPASVSIEEDSPASDSPECVSPEDSSSEEGVSSEKWSEELDTESDQDVLNDSTLKRVLELLYEEQDCLGEGGYGTLFAGIRRKTGHLVHQGRQIQRLLEKQTELQRQKTRLEAARDASYVAVTSPAPLPWWFAGVPIYTPAPGWERQRGRGKPRPSPPPPQPAFTSANWFEAHVSWTLPGGFPQRFGSTRNSAPSFSTREQTTSPPAATRP
ncbi:uncharacterized protein [Hoplias malabaricus]|uniref:uncharacterized protein isoform X3 n=1 Tax=Hoplias malabaricus TaxID=27720 RepID=UPI0034630CAA